MSDHPMTAERLAEIRTKLLSPPRFAAFYDEGHELLAEVERLSTRVNELEADYKLKDESHHRLSVSYVDLEAECDRLSARNRELEGAIEDALNARPNQKALGDALRGSP